MALISRKQFLSLLALVLFQVGLPSANAAVGPTLKPTRLGQTVIWRGKKYTAIKSGRKLIWNKGVALPAPRSSATQTPRATPTPTATQVAATELPKHGTFQIDLAASSEVPNGETRIFYPSDPHARGKGFVITREKNSLIAFDVNCTHETCPVEMGTPHLVCNCHMSYFNRISGVVEGGPAVEPLRGYPVSEATGRIVVSDSY